MEQLRGLDDVAYVRFASGFRKFREAKDFEAALAELSDNAKRTPSSELRFVSVIRGRALRRARNR